MLGLPNARALGLEALDVSHSPPVIDLDVNFAIAVEYWRTFPDPLSSPPLTPSPFALPCAYLFPPMLRVSISNLSSCAFPCHNPSKLHCSLAGGGRKRGQPFDPVAQGYETLGYWLLYHFNIGIYHGQQLESYPNERRAGLFFLIVPPYCVVLSLVTINSDPLSVLTSHSNRSR